MRIIHYSVKTIIFIILLITNLSAYATDKTEGTATTICDGKYWNGTPVHVVIDWDWYRVQVNETYLHIAGTNLVGNGITTRHFENQLGRESYFVILHPYGSPVALIQASTETDEKGNPETLNAAYLTCRKSFDKPFMERMLG